MDVKIWNWLISWMKDLWRHLFGVKEVHSIKIESEPEIMIPKQLGAGNMGMSQSRLKALAEDVSFRESAIDAKVREAEIERIRAETKIKALEAQGKIDNDKRLTLLEEKRIELRAEEIRAERERLDRIAQEEQERLRFVAEQEQMRLNNEQARAQEQEKRERKEKQAAERREQKERDKQKRSEARKVFWANSREQFKSFWSAATPWFGQAAGSKRVRQFVAALLLLLFVYGLYATEIGQTWLYQVLSIVETNQMIIIGLLAAALLSVFVYWLVKTDRWQSVLSFVVSQRKSFGIMALIAAIVGLNYTFYQWGYLSVWSTQASAWLMENWQYCWYALVVLMAVLVIWFWYSKRFVNARQSLRNVGVNTGSNINSFVRNLSIATGVLFAIGLSFVAIFGAFIGTSWIILGSIGLIPVVAFSWRPSIGLWFRCLLSFVLEILAVSAFLPSAY